MAWIGKAVGGTFGFLVGGPVGALFGAALGHGFDAKKKGEQGSFQEQYQEPLEQEVPIRCPQCNNLIGVPGPGHYKCHICGHEFLYRPTRADEKAYEEPRRDFAQDSYRKQAREATQHPRQMVFFTTAFALMAKLAKADGPVTQSEIDTIENLMQNHLHLDSRARKLAISIFNESKNSPHDYRDIARQFFSEFNHEPQMLITMADILLQIAAADGTMHSEEEKFIQTVVEILGISDSEFDLLRSRYFRVNEKHYRILGCSPDDDEETIRSRYRKLVQDYHPDKIIGKGLPEEFVELAEKKFREIQGAWEEIQKERGLN